MLTINDHKINAEAVSQTQPHLAMDSSQGYLSLALTLPSRQLSIHQSLPQQQSDTLLAGVESLLARASLSVADVPTTLSYIAVGQGPGSFVGLRLAISAAQGLSQAWGLPVITVDDLALLAWQLVRSDVTVNPGDRITVAIDARMNQVYTASFDYLAVEHDNHSAGGQLQSQERAQLLSPETLASQLTNSGNAGNRKRGKHWLVGNGFDAYTSLSSLNSRNHDIIVITPNAAYMGDYLAAHNRLTVENLVAAASRVPLPQYIRDNVADKPSAAKPS